MQKTIWEKISNFMRPFITNVIFTIPLIVIVSIIVLCKIRPNASFQEWVDFLMVLGTFCLAIVALFPPRSKEKLRGIYAFEEKKGKVILCMQVRNIGIIPAKIGSEKNYNGKIQIGIIREKNKNPKDEIIYATPYASLKTIPDTICFFDHVLKNKEVF